jgi:uncharacterized protein with PQ loop repeat
MHRLFKKILSKKTRRTTIDKLMAVTAIIHPLTAIPQVLIIYSTQNVSGVSLTTWLSFMIMGSIFLAYGIIHRLKPFIVTQILWFIVDVLVVLGVLMYR